MQHSGQRIEFQKLKWIIFTSGVKESSRIPAEKVLGKENFFCKTTCWSFLNFLSIQTALLLPEYLFRVLVEAYYSYYYF